MPIYNVIEYRDNYSKTFGTLWQYCRDEPTFHANGAIVDFDADNATTDLLKIKEKMTGQASTMAQKMLK